jgi:hypothetical protein
MLVRKALLPLVAVFASACGTAQTGPVTSIPAAPPPPAGWVSLASGGSSGPEFSGFAAHVGGRPLAINVVCVGNGRLVVTLGPGPLVSAPSSGQDSVVFPCSRDGATAQRRELPAGIAAGEFEVAGAIVPGFGETEPSAFVVSLEEAAP